MGINMTSKKERTKTKALIADVGGTNCRLAIVELGTPKSLKILSKRTYSSKDYESLESIIGSFLEDQELPSLAVVSCAGPVFDNSEVSFTNLSWSVKKENLVSKTGINFVHIMNDFKATGYGVLNLTEESFVSVSEGSPKPLGVIAVVGPGTGLGRSFVTFDEQGDRFVHSSEGGHTDFAPFNEETFGLLNFARKKFDCEHISHERFVSGSGLSMIHEFFYKEKWDPKEIVESAFKDKKGKKSLEMFLDLLGRKLGDTALLLLPKGGLYVAGGVIAKIINRFEKDTHKLETVLEIIKEGFFKKGREKIRKILEKIPLRIIKEENIGMRGVNWVAHKY